MIWRKKIRMYIAGVGLICCVATAWADTVQLRDGKSLSGRITGETADSIIIETSAGRFTFARTQVLQMTKESAASNHRRDMERYLAQGKIDAAMAVYHQTGLSQSFSHAAFIDIFAQQLRTTAAGAIATSATTAELISTFQKDATTPPELLILVAAFATEHGDAAAALPLLQAADKRATPPFLWPVDTLMPLLDRIATAAVKTHHGTLVAASAALAARLPSQTDSRRNNQLAVYAQIDDLLRHGEFLRASALFHPDQFLHRADLFVPLAERLITAILANPSANSVVPALESSTATILPYIDPELRLQAYRTLINRLYDTGRADDAQAAADKLSSTDPDAGAILEHLVEFRRRKATLPQDSPVATYKLASWAKSMGLLEEAEGLFLTLRGDPRFTETVNLQLNIIDHAQSAKAVRRLRSIFDRSDIEQLKQEVNAFLQTSPPDQFAQEARNLLQLADFEKWSQQRSSHGKAEAEFQHAERLANRGEYDEALSHLNQIQMDREDTAAAQKANSLRDRIMREKLLKSPRVREGQTTPPGLAP